MPRDRLARGPTAIAGGKGGCGKTTTVLGLALALVERGRRPVVVDADVDVPDLHIRADVDREPGLPALARGARPTQVVQPSPEFPGVGVLSTGTADTPVDVAIRRLAPLDRPVLIDCPAGASPDAAAPLRAAERTILVTLATPVSRQDTAKTARMARALAAPAALAVERPPSEDTIGSRAGGADDQVASVERAEPTENLETWDCATVRLTEAGSQPLADGGLRDRYATCVDRLRGGDHLRARTANGESDRSGRNF
jgi:septum site-determining protein MinD